MIRFSFNLKERAHGVVSMLKSTFILRYWDNVEWLSVKYTHLILQDMIFSGGIPFLLEKRGYGDVVRSTRPAEHIDR